ncbi:MAG: aminopeptidase P family protein [Deltaproteobacteria bacterium]|nr:aminopeptidase P family protein [Deltaproteobacteria bacterium]
MIVLAAISALAIAVWGPRHRLGFVLLLSSAAPLTVFVALLFAGNLPLPVAGLLLALTMAVALIVARAIPRVVAVPFVFLALVTAVPDLDSAVVHRIALGALFVAVCALVRLRFDLAMRAGCAAFGAQLVVRSSDVFSGGHARLTWELIVAALLACAFLVTRLAPALEATRSGPSPTSWPVLRANVGMGAFGVFLAVLFCGLFAPSLPPPLTPVDGARLQKLREKTSQGGLVWMLPSESITWDDASRDEFPWLDNLDARWLTGRPLTGLYHVGRGDRLSGGLLWGAFSLHHEIRPLRMVKDQDELVQLRMAAQATVEAVRDVVPLIVPGASEDAIAKALSENFKRHGCEADSFPPLVISGAEAAEPHGTGARGVLKAGDLLVMDVGCYRHHYASDFTRTFPVSGTFTPEQKKDVEAVLAAQQAALAACKPGALMFSRGKEPSLSQLAADALEARGLPRSYGHGLGHTVGLFVHDVDDSKPFVAGSVYTIEPGHYVKGRFGIRIEDTYLVREKDCAALTEGMPADPASIEALMAASKK